MRRMLKKIGFGVLYLLIRAVIGIRYRLRIRGLEKITAQHLSKKGGVLFLPNHPAMVDPFILMLVLWYSYKPHPLVVENYYYLKGFHTIQKMGNAIPIPNLGGSVNRWKQKKVEKCFHLIEQGIKERENYLIYPSGRLKLGAEEMIGGASFAYNLLQECPEANVVLVRTTGLWGSRFSRAITGKVPSLPQVFWEAAKVVLKNLIFLTPRREVTIDFEPMPDHFLTESTTRLAFNQALEKWYNSCGPEPLKLVSDHFWNESYPQIVTPDARAQKSRPIFIDPKTEKEVIQKIADLAKRKTAARGDHLARDLGLDSLDFAELQTFLIQRYELSSLDPDDFQTVEDVLTACARPDELAERSVKKRGSFEWPKEDSRPAILPPEGPTIQHAFLKACDRMKYYTACADERMGIVSYRRLKLIALTLSYHFRKMEDKKIGVLLPSSTISYAIVMALLLADKVPVMLNWTVGSRALNHCKEAALLTKVITSSRFLEHLTDGDLGVVEELLLFAEDIRSSISLWNRLKGFFSLFRDADHLIKNLKLENVSSSDPAVILFTSGTESLPKGVPLSHQNILANQIAGLSCVDLFPSDVLYGVLPPFHSFGFSVTGLFPLLAGLKVFYAPDPTQYFAMAQDIESWKITFLCSAPTFMKGLFHAAKPGQLRSLRLAVGGAEKVAAPLFQAMEDLGGSMLEGYGITECGPIVTLTRPGIPREGVGFPLPGVELCIIHAETLEKVERGVDGEICIHGPNVFSGYLGNRASPFIEIDGKKWYRSGDRGHLTEPGALILTGRLKRFIKIGAEMVSLTGVEEELLQETQCKGWAPQSEGPPLAVVSKEPNSDKPQIVVFATFSIDKETFNEVLYERGFGRIVKISEVREIKEIPLTGTGKINYRSLEESL